VDLVGTALFRGAALFSEAEHAAVGDPALCWFVVSHAGRFAPNPCAGMLKHALWQRGVSMDLRVSGAFGRDDLFDLA
jgi:hypothetical protein